MTNACMIRSMNDYGQIDGCKISKELVTLKNKFEREAEQATIALKPLEQTALGTMAEHFSKAFVHCCFQLLFQNTNKMLWALVIKLKK